MTGKRPARRTTGEGSSEPETGGVPTSENTPRTDQEHRFGDIDPWTVLLEQLMEVPGEEPTARARPKAGSTIGPTRLKKRWEGNERQ